MSLNYYFMYTPVQLIRILYFVNTHQIQNTILNANKNNAHLNNEFDDYLSMLT